MFVFRKIWRALFSCNTRFEIRPFALLPMIVHIVFENNLINHSRIDYKNLIFGGLSKCRIDKLSHSRIDYKNLIFGGLSKCRIDKLSQTCFGFVKTKSGEGAEVCDLKSAAIVEFIDFSIINSIYMRLDHNYMPHNVSADLQQLARISRNSLLTLKGGHTNEPI